jgi:hypothetical protein
MLKRVLLDEMACVLRRSGFVALIASAAPAKETNCRGFLIEAMSRTHYLQQRFELSDVVMKVAAYARVEPVDLFARVSAYLPGSGREGGRIPNCYMRSSCKYCV